MAETLALEQLAKAQAAAGHQEEPGEVCREDCSGCNDPVGSILKDRKFYHDRLWTSERLLYRMARHIFNVENVPPLKWGVQGLDLLAELRELNPEKYDTEVKLADEQP